MELAELIKNALKPAPNGFVCTNEIRGQAAIEAMREMNKYHGASTTVYAHNLTSLAIQRIENLIK